MTSLKDFVKGKEFGSDSLPLPEGETAIDLGAVQVEETEREFDGRVRKSYLLTVGDKTYGVGVKVMDGIKKAVDQGAGKVRIIRQGTDKKTSYVVLPVKE